MIITEKLEIKVNGKLVKHYNSKGYFCKTNDIIEINVNDLTTNSHEKIMVKCDVCAAIREVKYQWYNTSLKNSSYYACSKKCSIDKFINTCINKYGVDNVAKLKEMKIKAANTCLKQYGVKAPAQSKSVMDKMKKTCVEKFGVENAFANEEIKLKLKKTRIQKGIQFEDMLKTEFEKYKLIIRRITKINKGKLFDDWNGYDYYDNEYIIDNLKLSRNNKQYPTIDHKISVYYGFKNSIPPEIIGGIENLCITKRSINSSKSNKIEKDFILK